MPRKANNSTKPKSLPQNNNPPRKRGRPTKFKPEMVNFATNMCLLGATNADLARALEVDEPTIGRWLANNSEFRDAVKAGRDQADALVAQSLYQKALSGDTAACFIWLKNRQPAKWRDKKEVHETRDETKRVTVELSERAKQHIAELKQLLFRDDEAAEGSRLQAEPGAQNGKAGNGSMH